jgi:alpha-tubulin suppressor-like RCC1 family protein
MGTRLAAGLVAAYGAASCSIYEIEGMSLVSPDAIVVGDTASLQVVGRDGSMPTGTLIAWASSDAAVATVDELGVVTGHERGYAQIEARTGDYHLQITLLVVDPAGPFVSVGTGAVHACGLAEDGRAWCWGWDDQRQLGLGGDPPDRCVVLGVAVRCAKAAVPVRTEVRFSRLTTGYYHTCGLSISGIAWCWGSNDHGQLGDGTHETRPVPTPVAGGHIFESIVAGGLATCGLTIDDALTCWGQNAYRSLANEDALSIATPRPVAPEHDFEMIATSGSHHCGRTMTGATWCWGSNDHGQLGVAAADPTCGPSPCASRPLELTSAPAFVALALGREHTCGLGANGGAWCWGRNQSGQLGDASQADRQEPMPVWGGHAFTHVSTNLSHTCGIDDAGRMLCWGQDSGRFGTGEGTNRITALEPLHAAPDVTFRSISTGSGNTCAMDGSGVAWCWGDNLFGQLGNLRNQTRPSTTPSRVVRHPNR